MDQLVHVHDLRVRQGVIALQARQIDDVLDEVAQTRSLDLHAISEMAHLVSIVARGEHSLGQQGQCTNRRLQFVADVGDKVTSNNINPSLFGEVIDQDQDGSGTQGRYTHAELEQFAAQWWASDTHFLLARMSVFGYAVDEVTHIGHGDFAATDQPQGVGARTRPQDGAVGRHDERRRGQNAENPNHLVGDHHRRGARAGRRAFDGLSPGTPSSNHGDTIGVGTGTPLRAEPFQNDHWTNVHLFHRSFTCRLFLVHFAALQRCQRGLTSGGTKST